MSELLYDDYDYNSVSVDLKRKMIIDDDILEKFKRFTRKPLYLHFNEKEDTVENHKLIYELPFKRRISLKPPCS